MIMAFALGMRHGFDLDHLATIDSMTRTVKDDARLSRFVGFLFSLGHGLVVILMSLVIGSGLIQAQSPQWLDSFGSWISIFFLFVFGFMTLWNCWPDSIKLPASVHGYLFKKLSIEQYNPFLIMLIGALFAFSFDTFTQVALFSLSASMGDGLFLTLLLGVVFMLGMMASDGLNGFCVFLLIQLADKKSERISRVIGLCIAFFSLILGISGLQNQLAAS